MRSFLASVLALLLGVGAIGCSTPIAPTESKTSTSDGTYEAAIYVDLHRAGESYREYIAANGRGPASIEAWRQYLWKNHSDTSFLYRLQADGYGFGWNFDPSAGLPTATTPLAQSGLFSARLMADGSLTDVNPAAINLAKQRDARIVAVMPAVPGAPPPPPVVAPSPPAPAGPTKLEPGPEAIQLACERYLQLHEAWVELFAKIDNASEAQSIAAILYSTQADFDFNKNRLSSSGLLQNPGAVSAAHAARYQAALEREKQIVNEHLAKMPDHQAIMQTIASEYMQKITGIAGPNGLLMDMQLALAGRASPSPASPASSDSVPSLARNSPSTSQPASFPRESPEDRQAKIDQALFRFTSAYEGWLVVLQGITDAQRASLFKSQLRLFDGKFDQVAEELHALGVQGDLRDASPEYRDQLDDLQRRQLEQDQRIAALPDAAAIGTVFTADFAEKGRLGPIRTQLKLQELRGGAPSVASSAPPAATTPNANAPGATAPAASSGAYAVGMPIDIEWGGKWWPGKVLRVDGDKTYIAYDDHSDAWNEWVPRDRIRPRP